MDKIIVDVQTGEITEAKFTSAEMAQRKKDQADFELLIQQSQSKENAKAILLERLGITEDEAKLLLA